MKIVRRIIIALAGLVVLLILAAILLPLLFRERLLEIAKREINRKVEATVDFGDFSVSLFRSFPNVAMGLDDLIVIGRGPFDGDTLVAMDRLDIAFDLVSVIRNARSGGKVEVRSIRLEHPRVRAVVLEDGKASWDIFRKTAEEAPGPQQAGPGLAFGLQSFSLSDGRIVFDHAPNHLHLEADGLQHSGRGDFARDRFTLSTDTSIDRLNLVYGGIPWFKDVRTEIEADVEVEGLKRFTLEENVIRLNALEIGMEGSLVQEEAGPDIDLTFNARQTDFRNILSLIPAVYKKGFEDIRTEGKLALQGNIKGRYAEGRLPAFRLDLQVKDGQFQYPDLPSSARNIQIDATVANGTGVPDGTVVEVRRLHVEVDGEPFDAKVLLQNPVSDPLIDAEAKGKIDLAQVKRLVPMEGVKELSGTVLADLRVKGRMSAVEQKRYEQFQANGRLKVSDLRYVLEGSPPPLKIADMDLSFEPQVVALRNLEGEAGRSDFKAAGGLENLLGFLLKGEPLRGSMSLVSRRIDLNEWVTSEKEDRAKEEKPKRILEVPGNVDFTLQARAGEILYDKLELKDAAGRLRVAEKAVQLQGVTMKALGGTISMNGTYDTKDPKKPRIDLAVGLKEMSIQDAFKTFASVGKLAPVAKYATGRFSTEMKVNGELGEGMAPKAETLNGLGSVYVPEAVVKGFGVLARMADQFGLERYREIRLTDVRQKLEIRDGRVHVEPFALAVGKSRMTVSGSHGLDQSLDYRLKMEIPRAELGGQADALIGSLAKKAQELGIDYKPQETIRFALNVQGTVDDPRIAPDFREEGGGLRDLAAEEARKKAEEARRRADEEKKKAEAEVAKKEQEARTKAQQEADRILKEAEAQGGRIRAEAQKGAEAVRSQANARATALEAEAKDPIAKVAAKAAADQVRKEGDQQARRITDEADKRAQAILEDARKRADEALGK